jgi:hypothetical protein
VGLQLEGGTPAEAALAGEREHPASLPTAMLFDNARKQEALHPQGQQQRCRGQAGWEAWGGRCWKVAMGSGLHCPQPPSIPQSGLHPRWPIHASLLKPWCATELRDADRGNAP